MKQTKEKSKVYAQEQLNMHQKRWRKLKLSELTMNNWIDYGLFWLYINIDDWFSLTYLIPIPVFSLFSWFFYCSTCSKSTKSMSPNGNASTEWVKVLSLVLEKVLFYSGVKVFKLLKKVFSTLTVHRKPSFYNFNVLVHSN